MRSVSKIDEAIYDAIENQGRVTSNKSAVVMYSGGVDSTVVCAWLKHIGVGQIIPVYFNDDSEYFHMRRKTAITKSLQKLDLFHVAHEMRIYEYEKYRFTSDTFGLIPGLKMIMQMQLMAYCQRFGINYIYTGYNLENTDFYPFTFKDELQDNILKMSALYNDIYDANINVISPFFNLEKSEIIYRNARFSQPADLSCTYSCKRTQYGGLVHCGKCQGCASRSQAFAKAAKITNLVKDETIYYHDPINAGKENVIMPQHGATVEPQKPKTTMKPFNLKPKDAPISNISND